MHTEQQHHRSHHSHCGCNESSGGSQNRGPAWYFGYSHDTGQMKMMDYPEYVGNMQTSYSNLYPGTAATPATPQPYATPSQQGYQQHTRHHGEHHHHKDCGCGCHDHDCHCECCIRCADLVEFARCGELRQIPITFDNDTRRERDVKLELGAFATESGAATGWLAALSETEFKLPPCGHKTVLLKVAVECAASTQTGGQTGTQTGTPTSTQTGAQTELPVDTTVIRNPGGGTVDKCTVGYATVRAEGCTVRPLVIAVAVLPNDCGAHSVGCGCGCCC